METSYKITVKRGAVTQELFCNHLSEYISSEEFKKIASIIEDACNRIKVVLNEKSAPQSEDSKSIGNNNTIHTDCEVIDVKFNNKNKAEVLELISSELDKGLLLRQFSGRFFGLKKGEPIEVFAEVDSKHPDVSD